MYYIKNNKNIFLIIILLSIIINGCGRVRLKTVGADYIPTDKGYESLLIVRTFIIDHTRNITGLPFYSIDCGSFWGTNRIWHQTESYCDPLKPYPENHEACLNNYIGAYVQNGWYDENGIRFFNEMSISKLMPNNCELVNIYCPVIGGNLFVDIKKTYEFKTKNLYYFGIVVLEFFEEKQGGYSYVLNIIQDDKTFQRDIKDFKLRFPKLYNHFKDNIVRIDQTDSHQMEYSAIPPQVFFYENFYANQKGWTLNTDSNIGSISAGKYNIIGKDKLCRFRYVELAKYLPEDYDVILTSYWKGGKDDVAYGLSIGKDYDNCYNFEISGNGYSRISSYMDDKYHEPSPWKYQDAIQKKGKNIHKLEVRGEFLSYYINDKFIARLKNQLNFQKGNNFQGVGICACEKIEVSFDDLKITAAP